MARVQPSQAIPRDVALQAWAMTMGPLPGVTVPPSDGSGPACAYSAQMWLLSHWSSLTSEQRAAVEGRLSGHTTASHVRSLSSALAASIPGFGEGESFCSQTQSPPWTDAEKDRVRALVAELTQEISQRTGRPFRDRIEYRFADRRYLGGARDGACGEVAAQVFAFRSQGTIARLLESETPIASFTTCVMELGKLVVEQPQLARSLVGHEIVHCFQHDAFDGTVHEWAEMNARNGGEMQYIVEGGPSWIGEELARGTDFSQGWWFAYLAGRRVHGAGRFDLLQSSYDAIGFFAHLDARGAPLWRSLVSAVNDGPREYFDALVHAVPPATQPLSTWASATVRRPWGEPWQPVGRSIPADAHRTPHAVETLRAGTSSTIAAASMAQYVATFALQSNVRLVRLSGRGHGRASFDGAGERFGNDELDWVWCVGSCQCPDGQPMRGTTADTTVVAAGSSLLVALSGNAHTESSVTVSAMDPCAPPDDASPPDPPPPPPPPPVTGQDGCLLGAWRLDTERSTVFDALRAQREIRYAGSIAMTFTPNSALAYPSGFSAEYTLPTPGIGGAVVSRIRAQGATTASWRANGRVAAFTRPANGLSFVVTTTMGGLPIPIPPINIGAGALPDLMPSTVRYECIPNRKLTFFMTNGTRAIYRRS